jgi:predicted NUDIX family NTP pyrophosphohydrolase
MCRKKKNELEFFLVHPGGPFYAKKNDGVWSIPKGEPETEEDFLSTAQREFFEETGIKPKGPFYELGTIRQKSGKVVYAWTFLGEWDPDEGIASNLFKIEWPPNSKKFIDIPEVDRAAWMNLDEAAKSIHPQQAPFLTRAKEIYQNKYSSSD